jgi:hypothetical protein
MNEKFHRKKIALAHDRMQEYIRGAAYFCWQERTFDACWGGNAKVDWAYAERSIRMKYREEGEPDAEQTNIPGGQPGERNTLEA